MTISLYCVLGAFALNYLSKIPVMLAMQKEGAGYNNKTPREQQAKLTGWGKRAVAGHQNSFEVTPLFAACVFIQHFAQGNTQLANLLSVAFLASRIIYLGLYLADLDKLRSLVWATGILCCFAIALC